MKSISAFALGVCLFTQTPSSIAQSTQSSDTARVYQLPYWKARRLYQIAYSATLCDSVVTQQQNEINRHARLNAAKDSLLIVKEYQFKNAVLLSDLWRGRYESNLGTIGYYKRKADFWKWAGFGCILLGVLIATR